MKFIKYICPIFLLASCSKQPIACIEAFQTNAIVGQSFTISNFCSEHQKTSVIDWGDGVIDTFYKSKKGRSFFHTYQEPGGYPIILSEFDRKMEQSSSVLLFIIAEEDQ